MGLSSDARILIDQARIYAQSNKLTYDEPIDVEVVTKRICDIQQMYTQHAGVRPFGVSIIFGGVDKTGTRVFGTHPSGTYRGYKATALGAGRETVLAILKEEYREDLTLERRHQTRSKMLSKSLRSTPVAPENKNRGNTCSDQKNGNVKRRQGRRLHQRAGFKQVKTLMSEKFTVARLTKENEHFEILVKPQKALDYRNGKISGITEVLAAEMIFSDANKGTKVSEEAMHKAFGTTDALKIADIILKKGNASAYN